MNFEFMTIDTPLPPCMPFPRALTGFPVSSTAKVMYCRMLDAMLSKGQEDENGILFVCFPVTAIAAVLSRSPMTVKRSLNELETAGLIMRVRQGMGDFFELYGEDAKEAAAELNINLTTRAIPGGGRVEMCGFPANQLEQMVEQLRDKHDVTISAVPEDGKERQEYSMPSINHEAEQHINAQEAEFGADGNRVFRDTEATAAPTIREMYEQYKPVVTAAISEDAAYRNACGHSDRENAVIEGNAAVRRAVLGSKDMELIRLYSDVPEFRQRLHREVIDETYSKLHELLRPLSQEDIDTALCAWNGNIESKHAVVRYMKDHAREKDTAAWLAQEYGGSNSNSLFITRAGSPEEMQLPWPKVQRRIAQLIQEDRFYTEEEQDRFDNIDPIAIREALEERGVVNGQVADPEKLDNDPFIQRVMSDAEQIAAAEIEQTSEVSISDEEYDAVRRPTPQRISYDPAAPVYAVGDTVYIEDDAYQITELRDDTVQLLPTGMVYPIYRAEHKEQFEQLLRADRRNAYYTEFLPVDPDKVDQDLRDTVCSARKVIRIAGDDYPAEVVKSRFMKLDSSHVQYVMDCMKDKCCLPVSGSSGSSNTASMRSNAAFITVRRDASP